MDRLERSEKDKFIFGVCGGLAANLEIDPVLVRFAFVMIGIATGGTAVIGYLLLAILMPAPGSGTVDDDQEAGADASRDNDISDNLDQLRREAREAGARFKYAVSRKRGGGASPSDSRKTWGIIAIVLGALLLGSNLGWYGWFSFGEWWPVLIVAGGIALIIASQRGTDD